LQQDLQKLFDWSVKWQMEFNLDKCKVMHFGRNNQHYKYSTNNRQLGVVDVERDLGILISSDLKVSSQCVQACSKANRMLGMINRTIRHKSVDILLQLYKSLVCPHLEYCVPVWSPAYKKDKFLIERVQHRFTRMIPELANLQYSDRLVSLGLWSLEE